MTTALELQTIALREFTSAGYAGTSIQRIADLAGVSKAAVLYHFASKEDLLTAAVEPAIDEIERVLPHLDGTARGQAASVGLEMSDEDAVREFVTRFIDFLLRRPLEVHLFLNQSRNLRDIPAIARAEAIMQRIAQYCQDSLDDPEDRVRVAIALAGSAYALAAAQDYGSLDASHTDAQPATGFEGEAVRTSLIQVMTEILAPTPIARRS